MADPKPETATSPTPDAPGAADAAPVPVPARGLVGNAWSQARLAIALVRLRPFETETPHGRSSERYRRIALTTISSFAVRGVGTLVGLVTVPLVLAYLGKERFGLWSTITTVVAWVALFDLGIANGLVNLVSRAHGRDDQDAAGRYVSTAMALLLGIAAVLALAIAVAGPLVPWSAVLAVRGAVDEATVRWSVIAALGTLVVGMPLSVTPQIYAGYQRSYVTNAFAIAGTLAGFAALLLAIRGGAGMPALVVTFGIGGLLASAAGLAYAFGSMPWLRFRVSAVSRDAVRGVMSRSFPLFLFQIGALAVNETQAIVLAHRCNLSVVADYSILMRLYLLAMSLIQASTASFVPSFREAHERRDVAWMHASFRNFVRVRMLLATCAAIGLALLGNVLLRVWLRRSDVAFEPHVWGAVAVVMVAVTFATAHAELLSIMDRLWLPVALVAVNGTATVALTYWLAPVLGVFGAVLGYGAVAVVLYTWIVPWAARTLVLRVS
ncbi:MAG TPA: lipopolysaccharide biosynthesis protein [Candidatus Limnocylindria bacterium]|nr:lipopolysaccharide biosynthesis protein [Candidatus Limnocylindria bacterium]